MEWLNLWFFVFFVQTFWDILWCSDCRILSPIMRTNELCYAHSILQSNIMLPIFPWWKCQWVRIYYYYNYLSGVKFALLISLTTIEHNFIINFHINLFMFSGRRRRRIIIIKLTYFIILNVSVVVLNIWYLNILTYKMNIFVFV